MSSVRPNLQGDLTVTWLIFSEWTSLGATCKQPRRPWAIDLHIAPDLYDLAVLGPIRTVLCEEMPWKDPAIHGFLVPRQP